jgi:CheY-like chemotaxis protein
LDVKNKIFSAFSSRMKPSKRHIFLAEDDVDDQEFLTEALQDIDEDIEIHVEKSGDKAVGYLKSLSDENLPCLIILDYNLPLISGHEILNNIREADRYKNVTKIVWSTSNSPYYEKVCLESGAAAYFVKPSDIAGIRELAKKMIDLCG